MGEGECVVSLNAIAGIRKGRKYFYCASNEEEGTIFII